MKACGACGSPILEGNETVNDIPENFDPNKYELEHCGCENYERMRAITRDMAIDACDLTLEGEWICY
jgi:uncharacterized cysteine cluster protein YcgN (CxxCxxCC family)